MELSFIQENEYWVAKVVVNNDFCVHLERTRAADYEIDVTTIENAKYSKICRDRGEEVVDRDFDGIVYPKWVLIKSYSPIEKGYLTERVE